MILGVIPSRYASTRFPAKSLTDIAGKSMIQRVYEQAKQSKLISDVVVATDHANIFNHVKSFGGNVCMTKESHASGTDRCQEALSLQTEQFSYVINIQGDEPFIQPDQIDLLAKLLDGKTEIATLVKKIEDEEQLFNPNIVKVVMDKDNTAIYFSRSPIPHIQSSEQGDWLTKHTFYKHIGMYAYRSDILLEITSLIPSALEKAESLEQLRWLENGFKIRIGETEVDTTGIDTPEDVGKATKKYLL